MLTPWHRRARNAVVIALVAMLSATSCSGDDGTASKKQFVKKVNKLCKETAQKVDELPDLTSAYDFDSIRTFFTGAVKVHDTYLAQVKPLVAKAKDRVELNKKWVSIEEADFSRARPYVWKIVKAAEAKNMAEINRLMGKFLNLPDHSDSYTAFLKDYGLTDCAELR